MIIQMRSLGRFSLLKMLAQTPKLTANARFCSQHAMWTSAAVLKLQDDAASNTSGGAKGFGSAEPVEESVDDFAKQWNQRQLASKPDSSATNAHQSSRRNEWLEQAPRNEQLERILFGKSYAAGDQFQSYDNVVISVQGEDVPECISEVEKLGLHPFLLENLRLASYTALTPVQKHAIPIALAGRDLMACAETGSGKTVAFLLPLLQRILAWGQTGGAARSFEHRVGTGAMQLPLATVLGPTRELTRQIFAEAQKLVYRTPIKVCVLHGGVENLRQQMNALLDGCHLLIGTPGRICDMMGRQLISLKKCKYLVLDEADRMLDMGFQEQMEEIVYKSELPKRGKRLTAMFSATFPKEVQRLADTFLVSSRIFLEVGRTGKACDTIEQRFFEVKFTEKRPKLLELLVETNAQEDRHLIFVKTKDGVDALTLFLRKNGFATSELHGNCSQNKRERHLDSFRAGETKILVATDLAARGLDIPNVKHVINYDLPTCIDDYVHRIGRTGRLGHAGLASSFFGLQTDIDLTRDLVRVLQESRQPVPEFLAKRSLVSASNAQTEKESARKQSGSSLQKLRHQVYADGLASRFGNHRMSGGGKSKSRGKRRYD